MLSFIDFIAEALKAVQGTQKGSNPGGLHVDDQTGDKYYVKHYSNPDQAKVEALTGKIYDHMGIHTVHPEMHGESSIKTKWNDHVHTVPAEHFDNLSEHQAHQVGKMYHAAVLTKNWDIVGLEHDNIVHNKLTGNLHAIDHGGAFHFRAQGGHKDYTPDNAEKHSLKHNDGASGHVFSTVFKQYPHVEKQNLSAVRNMDDHHIHHIFKNSGLSNWKELHDTFQQRRKIHLDSYS